MQIKSCLVHLAVKNKMVKIKFKIEIIWLRLIILNLLHFYGDD
jgi:hypothetical protein